MRYMRYAGLVLSVVLISDICSGMQQPLWSSAPYIGSDERPVVKKPKPFIPPVPPKSPEQLAAERKQRREQIWQDAYRRAYLRILCTGDSLSIGIDDREYTLSAGSKEILIEDLTNNYGMYVKQTDAAYSMIPAIDSKGQSVMDEEGKLRPLNPEDMHFNASAVPFKITEQKDKSYKIEYDGNDAKFNLVWKFNLTWNTNGSIIVNDICCAVNKVPIYLHEMTIRPFAIKGTKVIMTGNNVADEIAVSADNGIINCGSLFCTGACKLMSDKIANYGLISDGDSNKPKNDVAKFLGVDNHFYDFYKTYPNLFNLPAKNGFYNFGTLRFENKYVSTEDLEVNLIGLNTSIQKTLTQTGDNRILRIINGDFYKSATQESLKRKGLLPDIENSGIHIGGLSTGMIYTNVLAQKDLRNNGEGITLSNKSKKINVKLLSMPEMRYDDTKLTVDNLNKPKILTWDKRHENVMFDLKQSIKRFDPNGEIAYISGIQNSENLSGNKGEHSITIGRYGEGIYQVDGKWRKSQGTEEKLGEFGQQLANYLLTNKKRINPDGNIYNLHEYLLGDGTKRPSTKTTLKVCVANNPFSDTIRKYYEFDKPQIKDLVYDNFLVRIGWNNTETNEDKYVMTCNVSVDPEGKTSITEYLSDGALSEKATKFVIKSINEMRN